MGIFDWLVGKQDNEQVVEAEAVKISSSTLLAPSNSLKLGFTSENGEDYFGFYLPQEDRTTHCYVIGSSGVGKSKALANWILEDIKAGRGCGVIDPHGDLIKDIVSNLYTGYENVILVDLTDKEYSIGFNPLEIQDGIDPFTQTLELVEVFRKIWELDEASTPRLLEILRNSIYTLIESQGTILDIEPLLTNKEFREDKIKHVTNEAVASFWYERFDKWSNADQTSHVESTLNKVSTFTSDPRIRLMLGAKKSTINFREIMDEEKVILINLSKGVMRNNSYLLGALFTAKIQMTAMSRQNLPQTQRKPFYFYVDEFQNYATESFAEILSEARKYGLSIIMAHQSLEQLNKKLRAIILGNAKNIICFRLDRQDAELLVKYLQEIDPLAWKFRTLESITWMSISEQWEDGISGLTNLPERVAVLKTKGAEPNFFGIYELPDNDDNSMRDLIRDINYGNGYLRKLNELEDQTFKLEPPEEEPGDFTEL